MGIQIQWQKGRSSPECWTCLAAVTLFTLLNSGLWLAMVGQPCNCWAFVLLPHWNKVLCLDAWNLLLSFVCHHDLSESSGWIFVTFWEGVHFYWEHLLNFSDCPENWWFSLKNQISRYLLALTEPKVFARVVQWLDHSDVMCSRAWRALCSAGSRLNSSRGPGKARPPIRKSNYVKIIRTHMMIREIIPGRQQRIRRCPL